MEKVISPHVSKLKMDMITFLSITHRISEWTSFFSIPILGVLFLFGTKNILVTSLASLCKSSIVYYGILELRFLLLDLGIIPMTTNVMKVSGYTSIMAILLLWGIIAYRTLLAF